MRHSHTEYMCQGKSNYRNLNIGAVSIKQQAYFSLVRPLVEYARPVPCGTHILIQISTSWRWSNAGQQHISVLHIHRNKSIVTSMLHSLNWRSLENRRKDMRLCKMYKIDRRLVAISKEERLTPPRKSMRHSNSRAFQTITCRKEKKKMSFFPTTVRD